MWFMSKATEHTKRCKEEVTKQLTNATKRKDGEEN